MRLGITPIVHPVEASPSTSSHQEEDSLTMHLVTFSYEVVRTVFRLLQKLFARIHQMLHSNTTKAFSLSPSSYLPLCVEVEGPLLSGHPPSPLLLTARSPELDLQLSPLPLYDPEFLSPESTPLPPHHTPPLMIENSEADVGEEF